MNSFWSNLYEPSKDRRNGILFLITFFAFLGVFALGILVYHVINELNLALTDFQIVLAMLVLPGIIILIAAFTWRAIRRTKPQTNERFQRKEMSRDEIIKARSKLVKLRN